MANTFNSGYDSTISSGNDAPMDLRYQYEDWEVEVDGKVNIMMGSSTVELTGGNPPNPGTPPCSKRG